jgi:phospholipid transport system substrate-binding protein
MHAVRFPTRALAVVLVALGALTARAEEPPAADALVRGTTDSIMAAVAANRDLYSTDPAPLRREIRAILGDHVAFERIARGVMGRHGADATPAEAGRFSGVFTDTLIELYAGALVALEAESIEVLPAELQREDRARVTMEVTTTDGQSFTLFYSMALGEAGWEVRNMVVNGINLGLTFRNQFDALMGEHGGSVEAVIDEWAAASAATAASEAG